LKHISLFILLVLHYSHGQAQNYLTTPIQSSYEKLFRVDKHSLYSILDNKKSIYFDGEAVDSTFSYLEYAFLREGALVGNIIKGKRSFIFKLKLEGEIEMVVDTDLSNLPPTFRNTYCVDRIYYDSVEKEKLNKKLITEEDYAVSSQNPFNKKLYRLNPYTGLKEKLICDLDLIYKDSIRLFELDQIQILYELNEDNILIETGYCEHGGCEHINYFICDTRSGSVKRLHHIYRREYDNATNDLIFFYSDNKQKYHLGEYGDYGVRNEEHKGYFIFDGDLKVISRALPRYAENIGFNYVKGKIDSYNIKSRLDDERKVIVPYKLDFSLERSMLRIHDDQLMLPEDVRLLDSYAGNILKNFVYAKHNFKFIDIFYEAYFNLFDFYGNDSKKISRLTNVDKLLTPMDSKNLEIINGALNKGKK